MFPGFHAKEIRPDIDDYDLIGRRECDRRERVVEEVRDGI